MFLNICLSILALVAAINIKIQVFQSYSYVDTLQDECVIYVMSFQVDLMLHFKTSTAAMSHKL